jgi:hypothetical protein
MTFHFKAKFIKGLNLLIYIIVQLKDELYHPTEENVNYMSKTFLKNKKNQQNF